MPRQPETVSAEAILAASGPTLLNFRDEVVFRMEEIARSLRQRFERRIAASGLSRTQWRMLAILIRNEDLTQTDLARRLDLERATIGQALDRLAERGLIERRPCPVDRRVWRIRALPPARAMLPALRAEADRLHDIAWRGIDPAEARRIASLLDIISGNLAWLDSPEDPSARRADPLRAEV